MKTKVLLAVTMLAGLAVSAQAATTIVGSKHDLSSANVTAGVTVKSTTQNQTCVFCHAPHNAITTKLLWNRTAVAAPMNIYTSYNTGAMRGVLTQSTLGADSSSLLCLSCHSLGTVAAVINNTANSKGGTATAATSATFPSVTGNMNDLTNDHPVGINYQAAATQATAASLTPPSGSGTVVKNGTTLRLFKSAVDGLNTMECASCHSVHDPSNGKFLAASNSASALCIVCHVK